MKFIKFLVVGFLSASMLSSCLGDSEQKIQGDSFAFKSDFGEDLQSSLHLANGYQIADPQNKVSIGDCAMVSYTLLNPSYGVNVAENLVVKDEYYPADEQATVKYEAPTSKGELFPDEIGADYRYPNDFLGDRWRFVASIKSEEGFKDAYIAFYFDETNQRIPEKIDAYGRPVGQLVDVDKNQVVIDVRVFSSYVDASSPISDITTKLSQKRFVTSFSSFRQYLKYSDIIDKVEAVNQKYVDAWGHHVGIVFRFYKEVKVENDEIELVESYSGYLDNNSSTGTSTVFYSLAFVEE